METLNTLLQWFVSALGGALGAAALLLPKWGEGLLQHRISQKLEAFKSQQAGELEGIKAQLAHLGDRGKRSNEMEFQAIEKVWRAFVKAWLSTNTCMGQLIQVPDFKRLTDEEVTAFATGSGLDEGDTKALLSASDRKKQYISIVSWQTVNEAGRDIYDARLTLREQRIFMPPSITKEFSDAIEQMNGAQVQRRLGLQNPDVKQWQWGEAQSKWLEHCTDVFEKLATSANARLFREERR